MRLLAYKKQTGQISFIIESNSTDEITSAGFELLEIESNVPWDGNDYYVKDGLLQERPENSCTLLGSTLSSVPVPCCVNVNGIDYQCNDDVVELDFPLPGTYQIEVSAFPFKTALFSIEKLP